MKGESLMVNRQRAIIVITILALSPIFGVSDAWAYIDPGTGSYLLQIMSAGVLAALFMIKPLWRNIRVGISRLIGKPRKR
jgi:hypothetical protein